ncbi:hypothetical protein ACKKBG_A24640 [Auxenochlorella protothecoides x Auxenochlorella symbiontica]
MSRGKRERLDLGRGRGASSPAPDVSDDNPLASAMAGYASEEEEAPCNLDAEVTQFVTKLHADGLLPAGELPSGLLPLGDQGYTASTRGTQSLPRQQPTAEELDGFSHIPTACIEASGAYLEQIPKVCRLAIESQTLSALLALFARLEQEAPGTVGWRAVAGVLTQALHEVEKQTAEAADELRAASLDETTRAVPVKGIPREQSLPHVLSTGAMAEGSPAPPSQSVPPAVADEADDMDLESSSTEGGEDGEVPPLPPAPQIDYELFGLPKPPEPAAPESKTGSAPHPRSEGKERKRRKGNAVPVAATSKLRHSAQLAKWQAVQQSAMQAEEAAAGARDSEAQRAQQAEEWRLSQLRSGASDGNANFAPVVGDWRSRLTARKKKEERAEKRARRAASREDHVEEGAPPSLPPGWQAVADPSTGATYYANLETRVRVEVGGWQSEDPLPHAEAGHPAGEGVVTPDKCRVARGAVWRLGMGGDLWKCPCRLECRT